MNMMEPGGKRCRRPVTVETPNDGDAPPLVFRFRLIYVDELRVRLMNCKMRTNGYYTVL